jgi:hypothetical protein
MVKEEEKDFEVIDVATETERQIQDNETKELYNLEEAVCKILNDLKEIKKSVG